MSKAVRKTREEARRLFLTGEMTSNAEIARHVGVKAHTVGRWRREENWDDLRLKVDRRAAEKLVEKIATDRVNLNLKHYKYWELVVARLADTLKDRSGKFTTRELVEIAGILDRAQKGQRLARGLSVDGQTEEEARAEAQAENRTLVDVFIDSIKDNVEDPEVRDRIRETILSRLPAAGGEEADTRA